MKPIITCENLSFSYGDAEQKKPLVMALAELDLAIGEGEFVAVLGHNGSGKSTLAKHFNAILLPGGGACYVAGLDTKTEENLIDIRKNVGMVFQNPDNQIVATVVEEDVAFGLENLGLPQAEIRARVDEALELVGMEKFAMHAPHKLSGGQKQRVAIAGILAMRPRCIVLDEPTAMLDPKGRLEVMATVSTLNKYFGTTVALITHFMDEAAQAGRVIVMNNGKIAFDGTPAQVFSNVGQLKSIGLDVPQAAELAHGLRQAGFALEDGVITDEGCAQALASLFKARGVVAFGNRG
jgi:energy-coupling factor transport system ATP-binding protein